MIKVSSYAGISLTGPATYSDLKEFIKTCEQFRVPDDHELMDCVLDIELKVIDTDPIMCGEHLAGDEHYDILLTVHECPNQEGENNNGTI